MSDIVRDYYASTAPRVAEQPGLISLPEAQPQEPNAYGPWGMSWVFRPFDFMGHTVRSTAYGILSGNWTPFWENLKVWDPVTEKEFVSGRRLLDELGFEKDFGVIEDFPIFGEFDMASFITEMALDPLTFMSSGITAAGRQQVAKSLRVASRGISGFTISDAFLPRTAKIGSRLLDKFERAWHLIDEVGERGAGDLVDFVMDGAVRAGQKNTDEVFKVLRAIDGTLDDVAENKQAREKAAEYINRFVNQYADAEKNLVRNVTTPEYQKLGAKLSFILDEGGAGGALKNPLNVDVLGEFLRSAKAGYYPKKFDEIRKGAIAAFDLGGGSVAQQVQEGMRGIRFGGHVIAPGIQEAVGKYVFDSAFMRRFKDSWANLWSRYGQSQLMRMHNQFREGVMQQFGAPMIAAGEGLYKKALSSVDNLGIENPEAYTNLLATIADTPISADDMASALKELNPGMRLGEIQDFALPPEVVAQLRRKAWMEQLAVKGVPQAQAEASLPIIEQIVRSGEEIRTKIDEFAENLLGISKDDLKKISPTEIENRLKEAGFNIPYYSMQLNGQIASEFTRYQGALRMVDDQLANLNRVRDNTFDETWRQAREAKRAELSPAVDDLSRQHARILGETVDDLPKAPAASTVEMAGERVILSELTQSELDDLAKSMRENSRSMLEQLDDMQLNMDARPADSLDLKRRILDNDDNLRSVEEWSDWRKNLDEARRKELGTTISSSTYEKTNQFKQSAVDPDDVRLVTDDGASVIENSLADFRNGVKPASTVGAAKNIDVTGLATSTIERFPGTIASEHAVGNILLPALSDLELPNSVRDEVFSIVRDRIGNAGRYGVNEIQLDSLLDDVVKSLERTGNADRVDDFLRSFTKGMNEFEKEMIAQGAGRNTPIIKSIRDRIERIAMDKSKDLEVARHVADTEALRIASEFADEEASKAISDVAQQLVDTQYKREDMMRVLDTMAVTRAVGDTQAYLPHVMSVEMLAFFDKIPGGRKFMENMTNVHNFMRRFRNKNGISMSLRQVVDLMGNMFDKIVNPVATTAENRAIFSQLDALFNQIPRLNLEDIDEGVVKLIREYSGGEKGTQEVIAKIQKQLLENPSIGRQIDADTIKNVLTMDNPAYFAPYHHKLIGSFLEESELMPDLAQKFGLRRLAEGEAVPEGFEKIVVPGLTDWVAQKGFADQFNSHVGANWLYSQIAPNGQQLRLERWMNNPAEAKQAFLNAFRETASKPGFSYFETNPGTAMQFYAMHNGQSVTNAFYNDGIKTLFGKPTRFAPEGYVLSKDPAFNGWSFRPDIAATMDHMYDAIHDPSAVSAFRKTIGRFFSKGNTLLKNVTTRFWPSYWMRNFISDGWQSFLGGGLDVESRFFAKEIQLAHLDYISALQRGDGFQVADKALRDRLAKSTYKGMDAFDVYEKALRSGIFNSGQFATGLGGSEAGKLPRAIAKLRGTEYQKGVAKMSEKASNFMNFMEGNHRLGHFANRMAKGDSAELAASSVRQFLFDFGDVGWLDEEVEPYLWFWRWTRKNASFFTELALTNPKAITTLQRMITTSERSKTPISEDMIPSWLSGKAIRVKDGFNIKGKLDPRYFVLDGFIPQVEIMAWGQKMQKGAVGAIADIGIDRLMPPLKIPLEFALNRNLFLDTEIQRFPGEKKKIGIGIPGIGQLGGTYVSPQAYHASRQIRQLNWLHNVYMAQERGEPTFPLIYSDLLLGAKERRTKPEVIGYYRRFELQEQYASIKKAYNEAKRRGDMYEMDRLLQLLANTKARIDALPSKFPEE